MSTATLHSEKKKVLIPQLRFPEFDGEWELKKMEDLFEFKNGLNKEKEFFGKGTPIINFMDVYKLNSIRKSNIQGLVELSKSEIERYSAIKGDVFFTRTSETIQDIGMSATLIESIEHCVFSGFVLRARQKKNEFLPQFTSYLFSIESIRKEITTKSSMTTRALTSGTLLNKVNFSYPKNKIEQQKIASFLSATDEKIQQLSLKKELLEQYKKGVMQQLFSGKLRFKDENGEDYPNWEENILRNLLKINQGLQIAITERFTEPVENGYFYITNEFLRKSSLKKYYIKSPSESVICYEDDILMTRTGNTGQVVTGVHGAFHNNFFKISLNGNCTKWFLYHFLKSKKTQHIILKLAGTSTIPDLNHGDFYKIKINLPSIQEQQKIADFLSSIDVKIDSVNQQLAQTQTFKKGLLQQMFI